MTKRKVLNEISKRKKLQLLLQQGRALWANAFKKFEGGVEEISQWINLKMRKLANSVIWLSSKIIQLQIFNLTWPNYSSTAQY